LGQDRTFSEGFVNPYLAVVVLVLLAGVLFTLPLLPAFIELRRKWDAQSLSVIQQYGGEIRYFAQGFRGYISGLHDPLEQCVASRTTATGTLPDGTEYLLLGRADHAWFVPAGMKDGTCPFVIAAGTDLALPNGLTFVKGIYAAGQLVGGEANTYRVILAEKDIHLLRDSKVMRWAHAEGELQAEHDCELYGRISSDHGIQLRAGCVFQRLNAPRIALGCAAATDSQTSPPASDVSMNRQSRQEPTGRRLFEDDLEIRSGEVIAGNVVTRGKLHIGSGARVWGSVKSNKDMVVEADVSVEGSLISAGRMKIGSRCRINGPVLAEHGIVIASGTHCGAMQKPTTVSSPRIEVEEGVLVFGTLWAREEGRVVAKR
jgi:cytoskeletal protein CcmA (bactofilin family)